MKNLITICLLLSATVSAEQLKDSDCIRAIMGEASNQGAQGMLAVGGAIRNRGTLHGVYGVKAKHVDAQPEWVWAMARKAWAQSATNDVTLGSTHWENVKAFGKPYWANSLQKTVLIKDHQFYTKAK